MQNPSLNDELFTSRSLWRLVLPLLAEQILSVTIGMADVMMVASLGEAQVYSVSVVDAINNLLLQVFAALTTGGAVIASQYMGRGDRDNACLSAKQLYLSVLVIGFSVMSLSVVVRGGILRSVYGDLDAGVMGGAKVYFLLTALSYPFIGLFGIGAALFRSMRDSKAPMMVSILMNLINILGNAFTIFILRWGVAGAGAATLFSRAVAAVIMIRMLVNPLRPVVIRGLLRFDFDWHRIRMILRIGIPSALENGIFIDNGRIISCARTMLKKGTNQDITGAFKEDWLIQFINVPTGSNLNSLGLFILQFCANGRIGNTFGVGVLENN